MKISYRWLGRHVDLDGLTAQDVAQDLMLSTAEVERVERFLPHLSNVVVGHVLQRDKHPDADKLAVCRVDVGDGAPRQIVCGAPNVAAGQRVAVALPGVELPGDVKIKKSKIRGQDSEGMICSERELGLGDEHNGIWVLPATARIGQPVDAELGLADWVLEIDNKSLTHRPDLWGHRGLAAEIAAMRRRPLRALDLTLPATGVGTPVPVKVESKGCLRYVALAIDGVEAARSPDWMRSLLLAVGQRPIDLLVDVSNFVMLDLGQPNHVFDRTRLASSGIVVRDAKAGETMRTLDGVERALQPSDVLITSGGEAVALAGIMGGDASKVAPGTKTLLLEVAAFAPAVVRRTSQRLALRTDSSARFEKNLSPTLPIEAAAHFVHTLRSIVPTLSLPSPATDVGAWTDPSRTIRVRPERVRALLGVELDDAAIEDILRRLGLEPKHDGKALVVRVPSQRATKDLTIEQDLVEEVGRIHRYGNVPERVLVADIAPPPRDERWKRRMLVRAVQDRLAGAARFHETMSYSFVADALLAKLRCADEPHVAVINPVAEGFSRVRRSVMPSVLAALEENRRHRADVRLFEVGKGYLPEQGNERREPREVHELALAWARAPLAKDARFDANALSQLQGVVEDVVRSLELSDVRWAKAGTPPTWAHPGRALEGTFDGSGAPFAVLAQLEPRVARELGLAGELASDVACALVSIDALLGAPKRGGRYTPLPKFPPVKVDVALLAPRALASGDLVAAIEASGKGLVRNVELFDVYAGGNLAADKRSLAYHVHLASDQKTLGEAEIHKFLERVERQVATLGAELRKG